VRDLLIDAPGGRHVRLGEVAEVRVVPQPAVIERDSVARRVDVEADVRGRSVGAVAGDVEAQLEKLSFPLEYHAEVLTKTTAEEIGTTRMLAFGIGCAIATFLLLQAAFRSWRLAALAFMTLPLSLVGGLLAALIAGGELSLGSAVAFLALLGIAARGALLLIRRLQDLQREEGEGLGADLVRRGAVDRLGPVLTTAAAVALIVAPFVVMGTRPGLEVVHPMVVVILGGLLTTTFVSLFVLPALCARLTPARPSGVDGEEDELLRRWVGVEPQPVAAPSEKETAP
jgi:Cu/Ag efflux pump CusA